MGVINWIARKLVCLHPNKAHRIFSRHEEDIAKLRELTMQLDNTDEQIQQLFDTLTSVYEDSHNLLVMITSTDGTILHIGENAHDVLGYDQNFFIGHSPWIIHPDDSNKIANCFESARLGNPGHNEVYRIIDSQRNIRHIKHTWSPIFLGDEVYFILSLLRNISSDEYEQILLSNEIERCVV